MINTAVEKKVIGQRASRSKSRKRYRYQHGKNDTKVEFLKRSHSETLIDNEKVLNTESKSDVFFHVSEVFENNLELLEINDNCEDIYKKLLDIQSLINKKISIFKSKIGGKKSDGKFDLETGSSRPPEILSSSAGSLESEESNLVGFSGDDSGGFIMKVYCPFCSNPQTDKINLIKHLDDTCEPYKHKRIEKSKRMPFSAFQILPNNTFKCNICQNSFHRNIKQYFVHLNSENHLSALAKAAKTKFYSDYLFCSSCKVQVPNSYTQLNFHINHNVHIKKTSNTFNSESFLEKGICCVYFKSQKFKCLVCPHSQSVCDTSKEILQHFENTSHIKNIKKYKNVKIKDYVSEVYCEWCDENIHIFEIINHFNERKHKREENAVSEEAFELCLYCGLMTKDLLILSRHMESQCDAIADIRVQLKSVKLEKSVTESEVTNENKIENDTEEEHFIIVKGNVEIPRLFKYFSKFGEIIGVDIYNEKDVKITFREKSTKEDILLLQNVLQVEGVKLEVTDDENLCKPKESIGRVNTSLKSSEEEKKLSFSYNDRDSGKTETPYVTSKNVELNVLFQKVSTHLGNNAQKLESELQKKLSRDLAKALQIEKLVSVGFLRCGLSFAVETFNFYFKKEQVESPNLTAYEYEYQLSNRFSKKISSSELWKSVLVSLSFSFPYIKCVHKETQKVCTVTFSETAKMLTDMLRECLENNDVVRPFCLIIRFWLSVHELKIRDSEYVIISFLIFFLISEKVVNISFEKYFRYTTYKLNEAVKEEVKVTKPSLGFRLVEINIEKLFKKFLLFLDKFDFDKYAICLPIQYPVPKKLLMEMKEVDVNSLIKSMCILDPFTLKNLAMDVYEEDKISLLRIVKDTVQHYNIQ